MYVDNWYTSINIDLPNVNTIWYWLICCACIIYDIKVSAFSWHIVCQSTYLSSTPLTLSACHSLLNSLNTVLFHKQISRYPDTSVSGWFFLGTDFLMLLCLIYPEFRVPDPDGLLLPQDAFLRYILVHLSGREILMTGIYPLWSTFLSGDLIVVKTLAWLTVFTSRRVTICDRLC